VVVQRGFQYPTPRYAPGAFPGIRPLPCLIPGYS
jgi:hypothetical protein